MNTLASGAGAARAIRRGSGAVLGHAVFEGLKADETLAGNEGWGFGGALKDGSGGGAAGFRGYERSLRFVNLHARPGALHFECVGKEVLFVPVQAGLLLGSL